MLSEMVVFGNMTLTTKYGILILISHLALSHETHYEMKQTYMRKWKLPRITLTSPFSMSTWLDQLDQEGIL